MKRLIVPALVVAGVLSGCTGSSHRNNATLSEPSVSPSPTSQPCGNPALATKPVVTVPKTPAPKDTTVKDLVVGTGATAKAGSNVAVKYVGVLYTTGKEFDSSWSRGDCETLPFTVGQGVVNGFSIGVTGMKVGGRREVIIPPKDGYGAQGVGPIPPNATLIFVIDLVSST